MSLICLARATAGTAPLLGHTCRLKFSPRCPTELETIPCPVCCKFTQQAWRTQHARHARAGVQAPEAAGAHRAGGDGAARGAPAGAPARGASAQEAAGWLLCRRPGSGGHLGPADRGVTPRGKLRGAGAEAGGLSGQRRHVPALCAVCARPPRAGPARQEERWLLLGERGDARSVRAWTRITRSGRD